MARYFSNKTGFFLPHTRNFAINLTTEMGNKSIKKKIVDGRPLMISRLGASEVNVLATYTYLDEYRKMEILDEFLKMFETGIFDWDKNVRIGIARNAGFFPDEVPYLERYAKLIGEDLSFADIMVYWNIKYEIEMLEIYNSKIQIIQPRSLEPYYFNDPWSSALKDKKVLVVHPFAETIRKQYEKRNKLFKNRNVLPDFELKTLKAVQSVAYEECGFKTWFDALEWMCSEIDKKDFDVAIIGAGAYGLPLAAYVKKIGKQSIHMGGATQILFGIKGKRWENHEFISKLFNEHWVYPSKNEIPENAKIVEDGCYW